MGLIVPLAISDVTIPLEAGSSNVVPHFIPMSIEVLPRPAKGNPRAPVPSMALLLAPALDGHELGLLSEAGLPALADAGTPLVAAAHAAGLVVEVLPG
mgnify:CR=1 FL=1